MNLVKLKFLRGGEPQGREYTYISKEKVKVGDTVIVRKPDTHGAEAPKGIITMVDVSETEVESFKDKLKEIVGKERFEMTINEKVRKWIEDNDYPEYCEYCKWSMDCTGETVCNSEGLMEPPCCAYDDPTEYLDTDAILDDLEKKDDQ